MKKREAFEKAAAIIFTAAVWQISAMLINNRILLVTPAEVIVRFFELCLEAEFWRSIGFTVIRIACGFVSGLAAGVMLALLAGSIRPIRLMLWPFMTAIKAVPVASFIILCLIWISSSNLSVIISFLMVLPVIYTNVLQGIDSTDVKMLEMCRVFNIRGYKKILYVTLPQVKPYLVSSCAIAAGMAWKAGTAAEVIGIPSGSIGEKLYEAKIYLLTGDLFAWTLMIVLISAVFEKLVVLAVRFAYRVLED